MQTIFIGPCGGGKIPTNGASVKNYHILSKLKEVLKDNLIVIDTEFWKKSPKVLISLLFTIITKRHAKYILSLNNGSASIVIRLIRSLAPNATMIYWVIGGSLPDWFRESRLNIDIYQHIHNIIVEGNSMKEDLEAMGLTNISFMPNFKHIVRPEKPENVNDKKIKFIFISRIIPEKGVGLIIDAISRLNQEGYGNMFQVDFYGPISNDYQTEFITRIATLKNIEYRGFIDLRDYDNYNRLAEYDVALFPTYWPGEGCPGIVIDAYMAGLPIIASDWNLNRDYIIDGKTGILIAPKSHEELVNAMKRCIEEPNFIADMRTNVYNEVSRFDIKNILSEQNLHKYNII